MEGRKGRRISRLGAILVMLIMSLLTVYIPADDVYADDAVKQQEPWVNPVHTIWWKARMKTTIKTKYGTLKKGKKVLIVSRDYRRSKSKVVIKKASGKKKYVTVDNTQIEWLGDLCTRPSLGDYTVQDKENWVNLVSRSYSSSSFLVWVSLDKQVVNVFYGSRGKWKLIKEFLCATGRPTLPTIAGNFKLYAKYRRYNGDPYYCAFRGSGIHAGTRKGGLGTHTVSHSCVRVKKSEAKWIFKHVPVGSRIVIY